MANVYPVQPNVEIEIESVGGDLIIEGRAEAEIRVRGDSPDVRIESGGQRAAIRSDGDCRLRVPQGAALRVASVGGDAKIVDVKGEITMESVGGDLVIRDAGPAKINSVDADLELKRISGDVKVEHVGADGSFREIEGAVRVATIGADALVDNVQGPCEIENVGADLVLDLAFLPHNEYHFHAVGSDVLIRVQSDIGVQFVVPHSTQRAIELRGVSIESDGDEDRIILGDGAAEVRFEAIGGELMLVSQGKEFASFGVHLEHLDDVINTHIHEHLGNLDDIINSQINEQLADVRRQAERATERAREKAERIAEKVKRDAERMQREAERNAERARRRHGWQFDFRWPGEKRKRGPMPPEPPMPPMPPGWTARGKRDPGPPQPPVDPVTNEERLAILRMVENKQITVEEAERLLAALEGLE